MSHTPGPWRFRGPYHKGGWLDAGYLITTDDFDPEWEQPLHGPHMGFTEANARLIAAAPELLAALEAVEWVRDDPNWTPPEFFWCPWCRSMRSAGHKPDCQRQAAIARAKGESE